MAHRIRIHDIKGGSRHGKGMRRPLRTAIAVIVATAMLTPTIASAAPVVPDAPSPVPGVESSSPYEDTVPDEDTAPQDDAGRGAGDVEPPQDETTSDSADTPHVDEAEQDTANENASDGESADADSTAEEDAAQIDGAEVLSDGGDGSGKVLLADADAVDGRDYSGQVTKTIGDTTYILIGNEQQLRAIGSGKPVVGGPVYQIEQYWHVGVFGDWANEWRDVDDAQATLVYPGDADLDANTGLRGEEMPDNDGGKGIIPQHRCKYFTYNDAGKRNDSVEDNERINTGLIYSADANYIIFRDIDLSQEVAGEPEGNLWTPLMFSGTMIGAKAAEGSGLWDEAGTVLSAANERATISNVTVHQAGKLNPQEQLGIGFFASLYSPTGLIQEDGKVTFSAGDEVKVTSLILSKVKVENSSTEIEESTSLVEGLLQGVGDGLGGLYKILVGLLELITLGQVEFPDLDDLLVGLFETTATDETTFATGAFAGRVVGNVSIANCEVRDARVINQAGTTGGFVGAVEGVTRYDAFLSTAAGGLVKFLSNLLNIIPFLGLGDLITILLGNNIIDLGKLIPVGYDSPTIGNCHVANLSGSIGDSAHDYAGGFAGLAEGTFIYGSSVLGGAYSVAAKSYAGGFVGSARNGAIEGTLKLEDVADLRLWDNTPQTLIYDSYVTASGVTVSTAEQYAGGFAGALSNSYAVNSGVNNAKTSRSSLSVTAAKGNAGGFAGIAGLGWEIDLGAADRDDHSVVSTLGSILGSILTDSSADSGPLLSVAGIKESVLLGVCVSSGDITVSVTNGDNAGGLIGQGKGTVIAGTFDQAPDGGTYWEAEVSEQLRRRIPSDAHIADKDVCIDGLSSVSASNDNAGGIAGFLNVASGVGVLNDTLGLDLIKKNSMSFVLSSVAASGEGFTVSAGNERAAGGVALATGGRISDVSVSRASLVSAKNYAGGFLGVSGTGSVVGSDGLDLLGLGLVKVEGLLSLGSVMQTTVNTVTVSGVDAGMKVTATGDGTSTDAGEKPVTAGGFVALGSASSVSDAHVTYLGTVQSSTKGGYAGGFVGESTTAGLADVGDEEEIKSLIKANGLLGAVTYLLPSYTKVDVTFSGDERSVTADYAGGFAGEFEAGTVDNTANGENKSSWYAVYGISKVTGTSYAGGFGGRVVSGALAEAGKGISILGGLGDGLLKLTDLLNVVSAYIPTIKGAGVSSSEDGLAVIATGEPSELNDAEAGAAGGYIGYASGAQVSDSHVNKLRHTTVKDPADLEKAEAGDYFNASSAYAVKATRFAGGYCGYMDIGNAASVGGSLGILGETIDVQNLLGLMPVVATTIEHSNVYGAAGGYAVLADGSEGSVGYAGGFAGKVSGGHVQDSNSYNFSHIIGRIAAGGYAGEIEPGDVARVLDEADTGGLLSGVIETQNLLSLVQAFVPSIRNSETTSVPCGGVVRAQAASDASTLRGMAGGYVGHNEGGQIWGNNNAPWKNESEGGKNTSPYNGPQREAAAIRIRSVFGTEYAGGFTGLMESASTASTGSLSLLWGLVKAENLLGALNAIYPTEENTEVYGPLHGLTVEEWNAWVLAVGKHGGYGAELAENGTVKTEDELAQKLADVAYGMNVVAGRKTAAETGKANVNPGGAAGGYVGAMVTGTITNGHAHDVKLVRGMRAAGGFAGMAEAGGVAQLGSVSILGINLNLGEMLDVALAFVPVIKSSSVDGYRTGMTVASPGLGSHDKDTKNDTGNAGGYIGLGSGVQIWGEGTDGAETPCTVSGLRRVRGAAYAGGYAGRLTAGAVADVDTGNVSSGFLQKVVDTVLDGTGTQSLVQVLKDTMSTVSGASVAPADEAWGFTVEGPASGDVKHPIAAGGFAGAIEATVLGKRNLDSTSTSAVTVTGLRGVDGGLYAGGFVGVATAGGVAQVSAGPGEGASTSILGGLLKLGNIDAIQAFQPFIYGGSVTGVADGLQVRANEWDKGGLMHSQRMSGNAGGFAGTVMSGEVLDSSVKSLNSVTGINYTGGFVGYTGKSGIADVESLEALKLIGLTASIGDLIGTTVTNCSVAGIPAGYTVASQGPAVENSVDGDEPGKAEGGQKAGGFIGYADLAHITGGTATNLKRVGSAEAAGGFAGETSHAYLVSADVDSDVLYALNQVVDALVRALYLGDLQQTGVIKVDLGGPLELKIFSEGKVLSVTLLGLKISASLSEETGDGSTDVVNVTIGDSEFKLPCNDQGLTEDADLEVNLIKGNSAHITDSTVTGIADGYDVFGGGATQDKNGEDGNGYAGGFVGHNDEGVLTGDEMVYADVVRGTKDKTGPFTGVTDYSSNWWFNSVDDAEHDNTYHVYRGVDLAGAKVTGTADMKVSTGAYDTGVPGSDDLATEDNAAWARFDVTEHQPEKNGSNLGDWQGATAGGADLGVYMEEGAKAVLMADAAVTDNTGGLTPEPGDGQDPCAQKVDVTVQKVWNDGHNADGKRPDSITVQLTATYTNGNPSGTPIENPITVELSSNDDQSAWGDTWRKVVEDLPVAITDDSGVHYLTYTPTEVTVGKGEDAVKLGESGYTVSYTVDAHDRVITITNSTPLPETGGMGTHWFALLGILLVGVGILLTRKDTYGRGTGRHRAAR
ncbi:Cna B-type domain-containing protein [Bifidobacterium pullorum subsp. saeculare]|uniref:Cna B-type domain-containing protein n=1 Tax=Bifidobacterium pullorum TaxID=78448 RepID=UPI00195A8D82|nr:Cna B-type domain-containing protein [Bifidobacterium pullorum]MBM6692605.1 Cna B-type domain-containing protein [Bifidobacterium pullorum subsp. saeculare]